MWFYKALHWHIINLWWCDCKQDYCPHNTQTCLYAFLSSHLLLVRLLSFFFLTLMIPQSLSSLSVLNYRQQMSSGNHSLFPIPLLVHLCNSDPNPWIWRAESLAQNPDFSLFKLESTCKKWPSGFGITDWDIPCSTKRWLPGLTQLCHVIKGLRSEQKLY